jgi:hypothetical protein
VAFDFLYEWYEGPNGERLRGPLITDAFLLWVFRPFARGIFLSRLWLARKIVPNFGHSCPKCNHIIMIKQWRAL